jgi:hypothetical protein
MYLNPFRDFLTRILFGGRALRRGMRRRSLARSRHLPHRALHSFSTAAETCEARMMLSGPQLIQVSPNTGGTIDLNAGVNNATVENQAPTQLTFTFSAGVAINQSTLSAITVTRSGGDGVFGNANDVAIATPFLQVDPSHQNQVVMRFADTLPDDVYQIQISGGLKDTNDNSFNNGVTQKVNFKVDFGAQVVSVVPQPVLRTSVLNVGGLDSQIAVGDQTDPLKLVTDGDTFSVTSAGTTVTFQFVDSALVNPVPLGPGNVEIDFNGNTSATPDTASIIAGKIAAAINGSALSPSVTATVNGSVVTLAGQSSSPVVVKGTANNSAALGVTNDLNQITTGDTLTVSVGGASVTFQFQDGASAPLTPGNVGIVYHGAGSASPDTAEAVAADIVAAINAQKNNVNSPLYQAVSATQAGSSVVVAGTAFTPVLTTSTLSTLLKIGDPAQLVDGASFTVNAGNGPVTFEYRQNLANVTPGHVGIQYTPSDSTATLATNTLNAITGQAALSSVAVSQVGNSIILTGTGSAPVVTLKATFLTVGDQTQLVSQVSDGDNFTVTVGSTSETFEFEQIPNFQPGNVGIQFTLGVDTATTLAAKIASAINGSALGMLITASAKNGVVTMTGNSQIDVNLTSNPQFLTADSGFLTELEGPEVTGKSLVVLGSQTEVLNITLPPAVTDGDTFTITGAGGPVTFEFRLLQSNVAAGNVWIPYNAADSSAVLASEIEAAVNGSPLAGFVTATSIGTGVELSGVGNAGAAFGPVITESLGYLSVVGAGLTQAKNKIVVYFNQDPLDPAAANNPALYQVSNITDGTMLQPTSVVYNAAANNAVLTFASDLPAGTFHLVIGNPVGPSLTPTIVGTLFDGGTTPAYTTVGFIGDANGSSTDASAFNLYQFVSSGTSVTVSVSNIATGAGSLNGQVVLRLFDPSVSMTADIAHGVNALPPVVLVPGHTYILGVSAFNNNNYSIDGAVAPIAGSGVGSYKLTMNGSAGPNLSGDRTSFASSTDLGTLGAAGFTISNTITALNNLQYPKLPGGNDTPGNRDLGLQGVSGESTDAGTGVGPVTPNNNPPFYYNFKDIYGSILGVPVHNAITENQKELARQIIDMYARYLGLEPVETASTGLTIVTGDIRAVAPNLPPNAVGGISGGGEVIMNANVDYGSSPYGGAWFQTAFHEIGHALGLSHSGDAPGTMNGGGESGSGTPFAPIEPVFPGDIALVPAERLNPPDSTDINVYKFQVTTAGTFSAETIAQRLKLANGNPNPSLLDSVITLYSEATQAASVTTNFNTANVNVTLTALAPGQAGNGIALTFTKADLGAGVLPTITVNGTQIAVVLNTHTGTQTTANNLATALGNDVLAKNLLSVQVNSGGGTVIASSAINYSPLTLGGGLGSRTIIARNDDYFGKDSLVNLHLAAGTYYVAVSSTGNTHFDPSIPDSGFGGNTDGAYQLKMSFVADPPATNTLNDKGGVALSGDGANTSGTPFNFWFQVAQTANTIFVDKANSNDLNQDGSLLHPYSTISGALQAADAITKASPGTITVVRIEGNGGADGDPGTLADDLPYLIGVDTFDNDLADGKTFVIPKGVTVMMDAGAVFKLHSAIIDVGDSLPAIDRSGGSLQVLGTPGNNVIFTSLFNDAIGGRSDLNNFTGPRAGDWGGIVFHQSSDFQGKDVFGNGVFLDSVGQATFTFGGGQVNFNTVDTVFDPITISNPDSAGPFFARPAIWFDNISQSADAAMSADPNSFYNSEDRVGPDVYGNEITDNSINGFFIRIRTDAGQSIDTLSLPARLKHTDIVYVLTENLLIDGNPSGPFEPNPFDPNHVGWDARVGGSLVIDPGVIMKMGGATIQAQVGHSQLIAEGTAANPIIFTSLSDNNYGAGGTFRTDNDPNAVPNAGDWGGIFFNSDSKGSIDHAVIQYAGGTVPIPGGFDQFNPVEIQQADVRIADSLFASNLGGLANQNVGDGTGNRDGLLSNSSATIFVRGAQPVIVDNQFLANQGFIVSINANALNNNLVSDWGRSTGALGAITVDYQNYGPLVFGNTETSAVTTTSTVTGPVVGPNVDISKLAGNQSEGAITVDPTNPQRLFAFSNNSTDGMIGSVSTDGGATWQSRVMLDGSDGLPQAWSDPSVTADAFGNLFISYINFAKDKIEVLKSADFGQTLSVVTSLPANASSIDQPTIVAAKTGATGSLWITYRDFDVPGLMAAGAQVTGLGQVGAFSTPQAIPGTTSDGSFGDIAIGPNGAVMVAYESPTQDAGPADLFVSVNPTGLGGTFGPSILVTPTEVGGFDPLPGQPNRTVDAEVGLAWDRTSGRVYMVYTDAPTLGSNNTEIFVRHSDDNGTTWSAPVAVGDTSVNLDSMFLPRIAVDNAAGPTQGDIAVSWYDARNDPVSLANVQFFTALSADGGATFSKNVQVSTGTSNATAANDPNDFGDYTGLTFNAGVYYPMWGDNSATLSGNPSPPELDQATAKVTISTSGQTIQSNSGQINGMEVRPEEITTQTVWDDADIVHVVTGTIDDSINQHTFGGIRLASNADSNLVVKLKSGAGFTINGIPLDISDRIGGTLQIIGSAAHPVILTSFSDDTVGAGFRLDGQPQFDTNGDGPSTGSPGDWSGITLGQYSNDRNVAVVLEGEGTAAVSDSDGTAATAQFMGTLAPDLASDNPGQPQGGGDYQPLGFAAFGTINKPSDVDVYSFNAAAGTEVWFDIGMTSPSLASVLELVDAKGNVLATSNAHTGTNVLTGLALPMMKDPNLGGDFYTSNPRDAGMRIVLPGAAGTTNTYFIRVRSDQAQTAGSYELQVRLRQQWETPGSTIQYSTINYAATGVTLQGLPNNSPVAGNAVSNGANSTFFGAQNLGNLMASSDNTLSVAGNLGSATQTDWYKFNLNFNLIQVISGGSDSAKTLSTIFDIDYADGLSRADTTMSVYDSTGKLILVNRDSNVTSDQPGPNQGNGLTDLSRGSVGGLDPFIGAAQMPAGPSPDSTSQFTYYVAITSNQMLPQALSATFQGFGVPTNPQDSLVRLEPVTSVKRVVEDHIGFTGYNTGNPQSGNVHVSPSTGAILPIDSSFSLSQTVVPLTLSDVVLYGVRGNDLVAIDPFTGATEYTVTSPFGGFDSVNIKMRSDGVLYAVEGLPGVANTAGRLVSIDTGTGGTPIAATNDGIPDVPSGGQTDPNQLTTDQVDSFVWVGNVSSGYSLFEAVTDGGGSRLYAMNNNGTNAGVRGFIGPTPNPAFPPTPPPFFVTGHVNGMEQVGNTVYGVTSTGELITINLNNGNPTLVKQFGVSFTGLTRGPQNLNGGQLANVLFATTTSGQLMAFDTNGNAVNCFVGNNNSITLASGAAGIAFSPLDFNLWHPTAQQASTAGHGINQSFDNSRNTTWVPANIGGRPLNETQGGLSFYYGLENWSPDPSTSSSYLTYGPDAQYGVLTSQFQQNLTSNPTTSGINQGLPSSYNLPGGAHGSLQTNQFSLASYSAGDNPTLYFTYLLQTEDTNSVTNMRDSARVQISTDGGQTWTEVATNNSVLSDNVTNAELARYITPNAAANPNSDDATRRYVQPLIETNSWRQARIDLSPFAGASTVQIRFDFSTAGAAILQQTNANSNVGTSLSKQSSSTDAGGNLTGVGPNDASAGQNNNFIGFFIDDIIVGFANRGEMVTNAQAGETSFVQLPQNPKAGAPVQSLQGPYQLEIRTATAYGSTISGTSPDIKITNQFDDNTRFTSGFTLNAPNGTGIDGQTFNISDGVNTVTFEYDTNGSLGNANNQAVSFSNGSSSAVVARAIRDAINAAATAGKFKVTAELSDGLITGTTSPFGVTDTDPQVDLVNAVSVTGINNSGEYNRFGDQNTPRPQGRIEILNNTISNSQNYGIVVQPNPNPGTDPGAVINLPTLDSNRQVPGVDIVSNIIYNLGTGGILFQGSPSNSAEVPFGRIVNNTIYGGDVANGIGVNVQNNAAPTLINNIISNTTTGIQVDGTSSAGTVVGTELFKGNGSDGVQGTNFIHLGTTTAAADFLFAASSPGLTGNFYLKEGSKAIDSSLNSLQERAQMQAVLAAIGLPPQPLIAPPKDRFGQLRVDDPNVANAQGLGSNIFIDRGAVEKVDNTGPTSLLVVPLDNGPGDSNSAVGTYNVSAPITLTQLAVQFTDKGIGVDDSTANNPAAYALTEQDTPGGPVRPLVNGVDYTFVYNPGTHTAQFNSVSVFPSSAKYTITIATTGANAIKDLAGNALLANQANGTDVLTINGNAAPTLSSISVFQGVKTQPLTLTFAQLVAASTPNPPGIAPGHTLNFLITAVPAANTTLLQVTHNGTTTTVVPGTTRIQPGDTVTWTPVASAVGLTTAFKVVALDVQNAVSAPQLSQSSPPVDVIVNQVDIAPTLTHVNTLSLAGSGSPFVIPYATFLAASDATFVAGHQLGFKFTGSLLAGSALQIQQGVSAPTNVVFGTGAGSTTFTPGSVLIWTAPVEAVQTDVMPFTVQAYDITNAGHNPAYPSTLILSGTDVPVTITVSNKASPTLNFSIANGLQFTRNRNVYDVVTFDDIMNPVAPFNATFPPGDAQGFRVDSVINGALQISHDNGQNWSAAGVGTIVLKNNGLGNKDQLRWLDSPLPSTIGVHNGFTVAAYDATTQLASTDGLIKFNLINVAPTIANTPITLTGAVQQTAFAISYQTILTATGATDGNNDVIRFVIPARNATESANGSMSITKSGSNTPVAITFWDGTTAGLATATKFSPGDVVNFTGAAGKTGVLPAFRVRAYDGLVVSATGSQVQIKVDPFGTQFNLTGSWVTASGLAKITQTGANLSVIDQNNNGASGSYTSLNTFKVSGSTFGTKTATIDITTADNGRIVWSDGTVWLRLSLGGPYIVNGGGFTNQLASIVQNSVQLTFNVGGQTSSGSILNSTQVRAIDFGNAVGNIGPSQISFNNGQVWTKLDLPPTWTSNKGGVPAKIIQDGTTTLKLIDEFGNSTTAQFTDATHLSSPLMGVGTISQGKISWTTNNDIWSESLTITGSKNSTGTTTITATPTSLVMSDGTNTFNAQITSSTTVVITVGTAAMPAGTIGTRQNGKIVWSNGVTWNNFDFNALNALFDMATSFPFP